MVGQIWHAPSQKQKELEVGGGGGCGLVPVNYRNSTMVPNLGAAPVGGGPCLGRIGAHLGVAGLGEVGGELTEVGGHLNRPDHLHVADHLRKENTMGQMSGKRG